MELIDIVLKICLVQSFFYHKPKKFRDKTILGENTGSDAEMRIVKSTASMLEEPTSDNEEPILI